VAGLSREDYLGLQANCRQVVRNPQLFRPSQVQVCRLVIRN
jgi:hypothetical protein